MQTATHLHWFRQDLRLRDNPALAQCLSQGGTIALYHYETATESHHEIGAAGKWWLHHSLDALNTSLHHHLTLTQGDALVEIPRLCKQHGIKVVCWNQTYEPWRVKQDQKLQEILKKAGITVEIFNGSLLWQPEQITKDDGTPYRVFTPFYRKGCLHAAPPRKPLEAPALTSLIPRGDDSLNLDDLHLLPQVKWDESIAAAWTPGETAGLERLDAFITHGLAHYKKGRNIPAKPYVSRLSPHLHWGEISPHQAWYAASACGNDENVDHFLSELGWREFSYYLLHHNPDLQSTNIQTKFNAFPWAENESGLKAWQTGRTGIPIVDAGMRELWQTGYMHNRVRMIVGSFLVKNLLLHWHHGEAWFRDCLVDADLASNSASWQWIAGCGADAAPYFRIFNPVTQGEKFDPDGAYTKKYVPELAKLPPSLLFAPWEAPALALREAGVELGHTYPHPIVDLKSSRERALEAFATLKKPS